MATATKKLRSSALRAGEQGRPSAGALEFSVHQDNTGSYHWEIGESGGASLATSAAFLSHEDAERAARRVYEGAGGSRFEPRLDDDRSLAAV
jgi:uncharacterized protein YegP (UPF0339 family)